jgi:hypothetical protein
LVSAALPGRTFKRGFDGRDVFAGKLPATTGCQRCQPLAACAPRTVGMAARDDFDWLR